MVAEPLGGQIEPARSLRAGSHVFGLLNDELAHHSGNFMARLRTDNAEGAGLVGSELDIGGLSRLGDARYVLGQALHGPIVGNPAGIAKGNGRGLIQPHGDGRGSKRELLRLNRLRPCSTTSAASYHQ